MDVIAGAADQRTLPASVGPVDAAIVGAPDGTLVGSLNEGVDALGIGGGDRHIHLADGRLGHAVAFDFVPGGAGVVRDIDAAARSAGEHRVGMHHHLPGSGEQGIGVVGIHGEAGTAGIGAGEERAGPGLAAVGGFVDAALLLRTGEASRGADIDDVGVGGVDDNAGDAAGFVEAHVGPGGAGVGRFVDAVAHHVAVADGPGFAGADPDSFGIGGGDG